jgi:hypothetical protein
MEAELSSSGGAAHRLPKWPVIVEDPYRVNFAKIEILGQKAALRGPKSSLEPVRDG